VGLTLQWVSVELSAQNRNQIYIPAGFGHAFLSLEDDTQVVMQIDNYFDAALSRTVTYADSDFNIAFDILKPIISEVIKIETDNSKIKYSATQYPNGTVVETKTTKNKMITQSISNEYTLYKSLNYSIREKQTNPNKDHVTSNLI
jgi:hypothetical protein